MEPGIGRPELKAIVDEDYSQTSYAAKAAKRCVETLKGEGAEIIVCLSHSGTGDSLASSEDEELAKAVDGIDVIVSGHTHSTLAEPLVVNDTYIVSSGPYCQNLGSLTFSWDDGGEKRLLDYRLIPIDETVAENPEIAGLVEQWKDMVGETYLARYGLTYDEVLDRKLGDYELPPGWAMVAAGNRSTDRAIVNAMSTALKNRFTHLNYEVNNEDWCEWALTHNIAIEVLGFIRFRPMLLNEFEQRNETKEEKERVQRLKDAQAFATPRS